MTHRSLTLSAVQAAALDSRTALRLFSTCSDLALLIQDDDVIADAAPGAVPSKLESVAAEWIGRRWFDVVTRESRPKVEALLEDARSGGSARPRQVNHPTGDGADLPLLYSAAELDATSAVIALGRDLSDQAQMQQRLVQAQQTLERDYVRLQEMERRYRLLFQVTSNGVLMVDAASGEILEANAAAVALLAPGALRITGRRFPEGFDAAGTRALVEAMAVAKSQGSVEDVAARRAGEGEASRVFMHLFHEGGAPMLLVRVAPPGGGDDQPGARTRLLADSLQISPDPFAALGPDGRVLHANAAFVGAVGAAGEEAVRRQPLDRYLGRNPVELDVLLAGLRDGGGRVLRHATTLQTEGGASSPVEVSAASAPGGAPLAVFIRDTSRRPQPGDGPGGDGAAADLVGRMPLREIVGAASDRIEEGCVRRALELTGGNRAAAAELLGLSRQTLYAKLKRLGLEEERATEEP